MAIFSAASNTPPTPTVSTALVKQAHPLTVASTPPPSRPTAGLLWPRRR
jgi:hypothetical protein